MNAQAGNTKIAASSQNAAKAGPIVDSASVAGRKVIDAHRICMALEPAHGRVCGADCQQCVSLVHAHANLDPQPPE